MRGGCFSPFAFYLCISVYICGCFSSVGYASQPSVGNNVHFCLPLNLEDMQARDSIYAATKYALNLNVGEPRTVRMIYFLPNDRSFRQEVVDSMKVAIYQIQTFYAEQMQAHGYGNKTFRFETDARGEPMVHRLAGQHPDSHYIDNTSRTVRDEIEQAFDLYVNIYLIVVDNSINAIGTGDGRRAGGTGGNRGKNGGDALVPGGFSFHTAAHELGHGFGLAHDFRDNAYIMSYGGGQRHSLSACNAEYLAVHPYFNTEVPVEVGPAPTRELLSPRAYPVGADRVSVQVRVSDPDGLHQVILLVQTREPHFAAGAHEVKACRSVTGDKEAIIEFDYDGVIPSDGNTTLSNPAVHLIYIEAIDTNGNVGHMAFTLRERSPYLITTLEHSTKDPVPDVSVSFSPDGAMLASGSDDTVKLWDVARKKNTVTFDSRRVRSVAFSPNGKILATGSQDVNLWDVSTGQNIATLFRSYGVGAVVFSKDGTILATGSADNKVRLWDISTRREIVTFVHGNIGPSLHTVAFSPNGTILASGSGDGTVKLWDITTQHHIATLESHSESVFSVAFSPDGATLASAGITRDSVGAWDSTVKLWDVATRKHTATLEGHSGWVKSVAFSPDGLILASGAHDNTVKLWDVAMWRNIVTLGAHNSTTAGGYIGRSHSVAFSPDGAILASGATAGGGGGSVGSIIPVTGEVRLWSMSEWIRPHPQTLVKIAGDNQQGTPGMELANPFVVEVRDQHDNPLPDVQVTFTVTKGDGKLRERFTVENTMTDANGRAQGVVTLGPNPGTNTVKVSVAGIVAANIEVNFNAIGVGTPTIISSDYRTWPLPDGAIIRLGKGRLGESDRAVAVSPDGQRLAVAGGYGVWLYDVATLREIALFTGHTRSVTSVAFSPDGKILASGSWDDTVKLWDVATRTNIATLVHTRSVHSVVFSPDGTTLASESGQQVKLWDVATKQHIATLMHTHLVNSVAFSPDGTLASGAWGGNSSTDAGTVWLWDVSTRRNIATLEGHKGAVTSVDFSSNVSTLASGSYDGTVKLWNTAMQTNIATLKGHTNVVNSVAFSSDGTTLASGSYDGLIKLWDIATQTNIATLEGHKGSVNSVAFSLDGTTLISGGEDGVKLWDVLTQNISVIEGHSRTVFFLHSLPMGRCSQQE